jgi:hypothetical protein
MKFRNRREREIPLEDVKPAEEWRAQDGDMLDPVRGRWSTTFLIMGSALLGATALALWNRRTIANMRAQIQARALADPPSVSTDEEIF